MRSQAASHAAGFHKLVDTAHVVSDLWSMSASAACAQFKEHRTVVGVSEFDVRDTLRQSQRVHCLMTHVGRRPFLVPDSAERGTAH